MLYCKNLDCGSCGRCYAWKLDNGSTSTFTAEPDQKQCFDLKCETKTPHTHYSVWTATTNETVLEGLYKWRRRRLLTWIGIIGFIIGLFILVILVV